MEIKIKRNVTSMWTPPRCRKPRQRVDEKEFTIDLREVSKASFPVAYTVTYERFAQNADEPAQIPPLDFRFDEVSDSLYVPLSNGVNRYWQRNPVYRGKEAIEKLLSSWIREQREESSIVEDIRKIEKTTVVFDDVLYFQTGEPVFRYEKSDYTFFLTVDTFSEARYQQEGYPTNMYRADELPLITVQFERKMAALKGRALENRDAIRNFFYDSVKKETIVIGNQFRTKLPPRHFRKRKNLERAVTKEIKGVFCRLYYPKEGEYGHNGFQMLKSALVERISADAAYQEREYFMESEFFNAFWAEIENLYSQHEKCSESRDNSISYTAYLYEADGETPKDLRMFSNRSAAISFAKNGNFTEVVDDNSGEIIWHK